MQVPDTIKEVKVTQWYMFITLHVLFSPFFTVGVVASIRLNLFISVEAHWKFSSCPNYRQKNVGYCSRGFCRRSFSGSIRCWFVRISLWSQILFLEGSALEQQVPESTVELWSYGAYIADQRKTKELLPATRMSPKHFIVWYISSRSINIHRCPCWKKKAKKRP